MTDTVLSERNAIESIFCRSTPVNNFFYRQICQKCCPVCGFGILSCQKCCPVSSFAILSCQKCYPVCSFATLSLHGCMTVFYCSLSQIKWTPRPAKPLSKALTTLSFAMVSPTPEVPTHALGSGEASFSSSSSSRRGRNRTLTAAPSTTTIFTVPSVCATSCACLLYTSDAADES